MPRAYFDRELDRLRDDLILMGSMVTHAINQSVVILKNRDHIGAKRLIANDEPINEKRHQIEADALMLISTQQPVASDMRLLAGFLEICGELERIGDYAKGIAIISLYIGERPLVMPLVDIPKMAHSAIKMLQDALDAFIRNDEQAAYTIAAQDDQVDVLYNQVHHDLVEVMMENAGHIEQANFLLWVAHNLERTADRVTNICERIIYTATGEVLELDGRIDSSLIPPVT